VSTPILTAPNRRSSAYQRSRVLHLVGSPTSDFYTDLSLLYARECLAATADLDKYEPLIAYITPDRQWRFPVSLSEADITRAEPQTLSQAV